MGLGCVGPGWRSEPLSTSRSPGPGWGGLSGDLASQRPPHLLRAQPRLSTRRAPTGAPAVQACAPCPCGPEAPRHELPPSLTLGKAVPRRICKDREACAQSEARGLRPGRSEGVWVLLASSSTWNLCPEGSRTSPAELTGAELRSQDLRSGVGLQVGCGLNTTLSFSFHQNLGEFHKQMSLHLSTCYVLREISRSYK